MRTFTVASIVALGLAGAAPAAAQDKQNIA
jgi:hypothetical protein